MTVLAILGTAWTAIIIWLVVRFVNRRERWAIWTAVGLVAALPTLYLASFGPACWWMAQTVEEVPGGPRVGNNAAYASRAYWPIGWAVERSKFLRSLLAPYSHLFGARTAVLVPIKGSGAEGTILWIQPR